MADTKATTCISELCVPLGVCLIAHDERTITEQCTTYGDIYELATRYGIDGVDGDAEFWNGRYNTSILDDIGKRGYYDLIGRCEAASADIAEYVFGWNPPLDGYAVVGRENASDDPTDFVCGGIGFSLKDGSDILLNSGVREFLKLVDAQLYDEVSSADYIQGVSIYNADGTRKKKEPAFDYFLYADEQSGSSYYQAFLNAFIDNLYDIRVNEIGGPWQPPASIGYHIDEPEYGYDGYDDAGYPVPDDPDAYAMGPAGGEPGVFRERYGKTGPDGGDSGNNYAIEIYDGFERIGRDGVFLPVTWVRMSHERDNKMALFPIAMFVNGLDDPEPYWATDAQWEFLDMPVEDVLGRKAGMYDMEFVPENELSVSSDGKRGRMTQACAKMIGAWCSSSMHSWLANPEMDGGRMRQTVHDLKANVSNVLAGEVDNVRGRGHEEQEQELIRTLFRIYDFPYFYVKMLDEGTLIMRVPDAEELAGQDVHIASVSFDSEHENTAFTFEINGSGYSSEISVDIRNKDRYFNGAPSLNVHYNRNRTDLRTVYEQYCPPGR